MNESLQETAKLAHNNVQPPRIQRPRGMDGGEDGQRTKRVIQWNCCRVERAFAEIAKRTETDWGLK